MSAQTLFGGLRGRIAALAALIALLATVACAILAAQVLIGGLRAQREAAAIEAVGETSNRLERLVQRLAFENVDYAVWDELHQRMPLPEEAWSRINLVPGASPGRLAQALALVAEGRVTVRYRRTSQSGVGSTRDDPAPDVALAGLALAGNRSGLVVAGGFPALFASHAVQASDGSGPSRGTLVTLAYITAALHPDLVHPCFTLEFAPVPRASGDPQVAWRDGRVAATIALPTQDGQGLALTVVETSAGDEGLVWRAVRAVVAGGAASAALAILIGVGVGWSWMRPFSALAEACRRRLSDPATPLPAVAGLPEAEVLREALERLTTAERLHARGLGEALERERTVNAVHQRFLAQLGHEIGDPLHALVATMQRLAAEGGRLPPEEVGPALERALELEVRVQEVLGLVGHETGTGRSVAGERDCAAYLAGVAELLRLLASSRGGSVSVTGSERVVLRPELLTPILVNLASNALRAGRGVRVTISGGPHGQGSRWVVADDGPGIDPDLAVRIADACARYEVLPGTPGLGLGLAVVLANLRALGGTIVMDNRPGAGVSFVIDLPAVGGASSWSPSRTTER